MLKHKTPQISVRFDAVDFRAAKDLNLSIAEITRAALKRELLKRQKRCPVCAQEYPDGHTGSEILRPPPNKQKEAVSMRFEADDLEQAAALGIDLPEVARAALKNALLAAWGQCPQCGQLITV